MHARLLTQSRLMALLYSLIARYFSWLGPELSSVARSTGAQPMIFFCFRFPVVLFDDLSMSAVGCNMLYLLSSRFCFFIVFNLDLFVNHEDSLTSYYR